MRFLVQERRALGWSSVRVTDDRGEAIARCEQIAASGRVDAWSRVVDIHEERVIVEVMNCDTSTLRRGRRRRKEIN